MDSRNYLFALSQIQAEGGEVRKYCLHPSSIISKNDGDFHFIDAPSLAFLYGVALADCEIHNGTKLHNATGMKCLYPNYEGDYSLLKPKRTAGRKRD